MGTGSAKKTPSKRGRSAGQERYSPSKMMKVEGTPPSSKRTPRETSYSHKLPTDEQRKGNGRVTGRSLIMWGRPRMAEKLLLHLHFECVRHKVNIPWDAIAHRLHPGSSGAAVLQHVNRLRKELIAEGHLVPPIAQKASSAAQYDPAVRGYVRADTEGEDKLATRPVRFDEKLEDPKFNLPDAFDLPDEDHPFEDSDAPEDEVQPPETPTPIRRVPRGPVSVPYYNMRPSTRGRYGDADDLHRDPSNLSGAAISSVPMGQNEATTPEKTIYPSPRGKQMFDLAEEDAFFNHSFDERGLFPPMRSKDGRPVPKRSGSPQGDNDYCLRGYPFYNSYERPWQSNFYGVDHHEYPPHPPGFPLPPHSPPPQGDKKESAKVSPVADNHTVAAPAKSSPREETSQSNGTESVGLTEPQDELMFPQSLDDAAFASELLVY